MRTNEVSRDRSMADNVKWILDRNPRAKIVLWAHNSHVSAGGFKFESMGTTLRRMYALDLRQAPRWFRHAHRSREIGAIYPDDSSDESGMKLVAPDAFDAT